MFQYEHESSLNVLSIMIPRPLTVLPMGISGQPHIEWLNSTETRFL